MQDKAIAAIGEWQLEENKNLEPVDFYIENMFSGKDYQMLLIVFEVKVQNGELISKYKGIDSEKVSCDKIDFRKYAYRNGSPKGGDITFSTKLFIGKKNEIIKNMRKILPKIKHRYEEIIAFSSKNEQIMKEQKIFHLVAERFSLNYS